MGMQAFTRLSQTADAPRKVFHRRTRRDRNGYTGAKHRKGDRKG